VRGGVGEEDRKRNLRHRRRKREMIGRLGFCGESRR